MRMFAIVKEAGKVFRSQQRHSYSYSFDFSVSVGFFRVALFCENNNNNLLNLTIIYNYVTHN